MSALPATEPQKWEHDAAGMRSASTVHAFPESISVVLTVQDGQIELAAKDSIKKIADNFTGNVSNLGEIKSQLHFKQVDNLMAGNCTVASMAAMASSVLAVAEKMGALKEDSVLTLEEASAHESFRYEAPCFAP